VAVVYGIHRKAPAFYESCNGSEALIAFPLFHYHYLL
jgi:hypothetical protein